MVSGNLKILSITCWCPVAANVDTQYPLQLFQFYVSPVDF